jgi:hypothetical protein
VYQLVEEHPDDALQQVERFSQELKMSTFIQKPKERAGLDESVSLSLDVQTSFFFFAYPFHPRRVLLLYLIEQSALVLNVLRNFLLFVSTYPFPLHLFFISVPFSRGSVLILSQAKFSFQILVRKHLTLLALELASVKKN